MLPAKRFDFLLCSPSIDDSRHKLILELEFVTATVISSSSELPATTKATSSNDFIRYGHSLIVARWVSWSHLRSGIFLDRLVRYRKAWKLSLGFGSWQAPPPGLNETSGIPNKRFRLWSYPRSGE